MGHKKSVSNLPKYVMLSFKSWIQFQEQPHLMAKSLNFQLGGTIYSQITSIDPRIELLKDSAIKINLLRTLMGNRKLNIEPSSIYFFDDNKQIFEIAPDFTVKKTMLIVSPPNKTLPFNWWKNAQFSDSHFNYIDNLDRERSVLAQAAF